MIAIPNMEKPQNCAECPMSALSEFSGIVCKLNRNNNKNNCPLIEIEEWNSYGHGKMYAPKGTFQKILDDCEEDES